MENGRKIAPKPTKRASKTRVVYEAIDTLGGTANKKDLYAQVKLIWHNYREDKPPRNLGVFSELTNSVVSQGFLLRSGERGRMANCDYEISDYENFVKKQIVQITSRAVYTLGRVENGEQVISEVTQEKLERQLDDPVSHVSPPRVIREEGKPEPIKPQPEPNAPTNMEELLLAAEKIVARQQPSPHNHPATKIEVPIITAIVSIGIAGLITGAVVCLGVIALSW
jgi:hypothetical protein